MSTIYIGERQSGKTTMLIEMSEKTGATIVVATYPMAKYIQLLAAQMGKKIPVPITVTNYIRLLASGGLGKSEPLYWWKEFDTYKVGTVANSCSTMHKIAAKEFTLDDFSHEHLVDDLDVRIEIGGTDHRDTGPMEVLGMTIDVLNHYREKYLAATKTEEYTGLPAKDIWWQMIQLLPSSYNQKRTVMLNYEVLANIYKSRRHHKLDEWHTLCDRIESLPYSALITGTAV